MKTIFPLQLTNGILFIDNSSLSLINECMRKSAFGLNLKKKQARDETALTFGKIIHKVLEQRYGFADYRIASNDALKRMVNKAIEEFSQWNPPEGDFRNIECALDCIKAYQDHYLVEDFDIVEVNGHAGHETPFAVPLCTIDIGEKIWVKEATEPEPKLIHLDSVPVVFTGRIDLVLKSDALYLMDHKTSSIGGANFFAEFYISMQFKGYAWALKQLLNLPHYPRGVIINGIINRRPTRTGTSCEFLRDKIVLDPDSIDEWKESFEQTLRLWINCILDQNFPLQTSSCVGKYGKCEFYDICSLPLKQQPIMLRSGNYIDRTWDPIEEQEAPTTTGFLA